MFNLIKGVSLSDKQMQQCKGGSNGNGNGNGNGGNGNGNGNGCPICPIEGAAHDCTTTNAMAICMCSHHNEGTGQTITVIC